MVDIFFEYKSALRRAWAEDMVAMEEGKRIRRKAPAFTPEEAERRTVYYMERIPIKFTRARYSSFTRYFGHLKRLGWVEETGKVEPSALQDNYPPAPSRVYYRLTDAGIAAFDAAWSNPLLTLYGDRWGGEEKAREHLREMRKQHHYSRRVPSKRRPIKV